ncbi:MAG TPA: hypothetical protein VHA05_01490 [Candidatus Saccharimonadales bacterium]|nr:hypothetical protein [Candidatus Saccharimonadales bacterium]
MSSLEAPTIDSFEPENSYQTLGVGYVTMRSPDGVRLDLSETGVAAVDQEPELAALLTRMSEFVARHGFYRATLDIPNREPCDMLRVSETWRESHDWGRERRFASVYRPEQVPGVILKAHDYRRVNAGLQFYLGAWLHDQLEHAGIGITGPAQLGMMQAPGFRGHRTAIMDYVEGQPVADWSFVYRQRRDEEFVELVKKEVSETIEAAQLKLGQALGWRGRKMINDPNGGHNLIFVGPEEPALDNLAEQELVIIDQPSARTHELPALALARFAPLLRDRSRPIKPIESPATSS